MSKQTDLLNLTDAITVDSSNNVGIGTSSPDSRLTVQSPDNTLARDIFKFTSLNGAAGLKFGYQRIEQISASTPITFFTGGSARMTIDSSGRVTMPYQPAFLAYSSTYTASGFYPFTSFSLPSTGGFNQGNHFNLSTGVFTVPVSGLYQINYIFHDSLNTTTRKIGRIYLNNLAVGYGEVAEATAIHSDVGGGLVLNLSANDAVQWATHPLAWGSVTASAFLIG